jgi:hypothetical protein
MADSQEVEIGSAEKAAYDLMRYIAAREQRGNPEKFEKPDPRTYYLTLYHQCIKAGHGPRTMADIQMPD